MRISSVHAEIWTLPLHAPFVIAQRSATEAVNVLITIWTSDADCFGIGASAPVEYVTGETLESVLTDIKSVQESFVGQTTLDLAPLLTLSNSRLSNSPAARAGLEMAIYDVWSKSSGVRLLEHFGGRSHCLTTDLTISISDPEAAFASAVRAAEAGYANLKVKVGSPDGVARDLDMLRSVVAGAPDAAIRIDANQAFTANEACEFVDSAYSVCPHLALVEQPVPKKDFDGLKFVKLRSPVPVFADESAKTIEDVRKLIDSEAVDGINIKLMKSGISGAVEIAKLCEKSGIKLMLGCMLETELGISAATIVAAGTGSFDYIDLDSHNLLRPLHNVENAGFEQVCDKIYVDSRQMHGWGIRFRKD